MKKILLLLTSVIYLSLPIKASAEPQQIFVTAYNEQGPMADGVYTYYGAIACPYWLPAGTSVHIEPLGDFTCHDRYATYLGDRFDVSLPGASVSACYAITGYYDWWLN